MEEGTLTKWLIKEGDTVESGDIMAEIETDKATMEFEAVDEGIIGKIIIPEGTTGVKVNEIIAILLEDGEDASSIEIQEDIKLKNNTNDEVNVTNTEIKEIKADVIKSNSSADRVFATPLARRIATPKPQNPKYLILNIDLIYNYNKTPNKHKTYLETPKINIQKIILFKFQPFPKRNLCAFNPQDLHNNQIKVHHPSTNPCMQK